MKKRTKAYLALLTSLLYLGGGILSIQETQARMVYTMNWNAAMEPGTPIVTSECLVSAGGPKLTSLTGSMSVNETSRTITFPLEAEAAVAGELSWYTEPSDLLDVSMAINDVPMKTIAASLNAGKNIVTMTLTPREAAKTAVVEGQSVTITVNWSDGINPVQTGMFQITLDNTAVAPTEPSEPQEENVPLETPEEITEDPQNEETTGSEETTDPTKETTEPAAQPTEAPAQDAQPDPLTIEEDTASETVALELAEEPTESTPETTAAPETTAPTTEPTEPSTEPIAPQAESEPEAAASSEPSVSSEPTEAPGSEPTTEPVAPPETTTAPTESQDPGTEPDPSASSSEAPAESSSEIPSESASESSQESETSPSSTEPVSGPRISSAARFDQRNGKVPVYIALEEGTSRVKLGLTPNSDGVLQPLPKSTRFSLDNGEEYYMVYEGEGYVAEFKIPYTGLEELPVLLDFSQVESDMASITLAAQAYFDNNGVVTSKQIGSVTLQAAEPGTTAAAAQTDSTEAAWDSLFLSREGQLTIQLPSAWKDAQLYHSLEMLTMDAAGRVSYVPVDTSEGTLLVNLAQSGDEKTLSIASGEILPPAGTYRVVFEWEHEGICFAREQVTFFINYSAYMEQVERGQEVLNDE